MNGGGAMTRVALHPTPGPRDMLLEQVRAVGLALRLPAAAVAALGALATLFFATEILGDGAVVDFRPERWILPGLAGLLLPLAVWQGEERFGAGFLWTLPVDRRRHALAKVFAGWVWLMAAVALFVVWLLGLALLSGGNILAEETIRFLPTSAIPAPGAVDTGAVRTVRWTPHPLLWLVPFTAATVMYLVASALALGMTLRALIAAALGLFLLLFLTGLAGQMTGSEWLIFAPSRLLRSFLHERYGLAMILTASTDFLEARASLPTGEMVVVGSGVPHLGHWAAATLLWTGAGLWALWLAASRHRERRRP